MKAQLQNWDNFCKNHACGNWHGTWNKYSSEGQLINSFRGIRSIYTSEDSNEVYHHNHYIYPDGKSESQTFRTKKKPLTLALFLDKSFSWGITTREANSTGEKFGYLYLDTWKWQSFFFETGFRHENSKISAGAFYDKNANLEGLIVINEHLGSFAEYPSLPPINELDNNWQGTIENINSEFIISSPVTTSWKAIEDLNSDNLTFHLNNGIAINCPRKIGNGKDFVVVVDWLVNPNLLQRGIRYYDTSGFKSFSLEVFKPAS
ncbi:MAG: DUF3598 family protein [Moorea sp. SIO2B7]|nr:DUF3598 family protein [Moorena sp. SIO2B7]